MINLIDITDRPCHCIDCNWHGTYRELDDKVTYISGELEREMACPNCESAAIQEDE